MRIDPIIDIRIHIYAGTRKERERGRERGGGGGEREERREEKWRGKDRRKKRERESKASALIKNNHTTITDHILPVHKLHILLKEGTFLLRPEHPQQAARREVLFMKRISQLLERLNGIKKKIIKIIKMAKIDNALWYYLFLVMVGEITNTCIKF